MKFNWGTGIFSFLAIFLVACAVFIVFAFRQDINLVHKDYYEQGADYSDQMNIKARSEQFRDAVFMDIGDQQFYVIGIRKNSGIQTDSGGVRLYRPSDSDYDKLKPFLKEADQVPFLLESLLPGRYIATVYWYSKGLKYEISEPIFIED